MHCRAAAERWSWLRRNGRHRGCCWCRRTCSASSALLRLPHRCFLPALEALYDTGASRSTTHSPCPPAHDERSVAATKAFASLSAMEAMDIKSMRMPAFERTVTTAAQDALDEWKKDALMGERRARVGVHVPCCSGCGISARLAAGRGRAGVRVQGLESVVGAARVVGTKAEGGDTAPRPPGLPLSTLLPTVQSRPFW